MDEIVRYVDTLQPDSLILGVILAVLFIAGILLIWRPLFRVRSFTRLQRKIRMLGSEWLRDVYVPTVVDTQLYLEYLLLTPGGLLLLHLKPYYGNIFAGVQIEYWTQVIGHKSFKFLNPLHQLELDLGELRTMFPKVPVQGRVLFTSGSHFPKGRPEDVVQIDDLKELGQAEVKTDIDPGLLNIWQNLTEKAIPAEQIKLSIFLRRGDWRRLVYGCLLATVALIGLIWWFSHIAVAKAMG